MSEVAQFCLLVSRAGSTKIYPLPLEGLRFGYSPPLHSDLTLYDGALRDIHGAIEYDEKASTALDSSRQGTPTKFRLRAYAAGITVDDEFLPPRDAIAIQLWTGNRIHVGEKYVLTVAEYQPVLPINGLIQQTVLPTRRPTKVMPYTAEMPPFVSRTSTLFLPYLPEIYHPNNFGVDNSASFLSRFLALFESVFLPISWTIDNFDLFLHPNSVPPEFLPWLAGWYGLPFDPQVLEITKQREILRQAPGLIAQKGTVVGLSKFLKLYTGQLPKIDEPGRLHLFDVDGSVAARLDRNDVDAKLVNQFLEYKRPLASNARVEVIQPSQEWTILDGVNRYLLYQKSSLVEVYVAGAYFTIHFAERLTEQMEKQIRALVDMYKPVHTGYTLTYEVGA